MQILQITNLPNKFILFSLSVFDSVMDDSDFEAIGQSMPLLIELNAGGSLFNIIFTIVKKRFCTSTHSWLLTHLHDTNIDVYVTFPISTSKVIVNGLLLSHGGVL